jgi:hypothetical protein
MGPCKIQKEKKGPLKKYSIDKFKGRARICRSRDSRSWSDPSSDLSSLLFMKGNLLLNEKFFFLRSNVDCYGKKSMKHLLQSLKTKDCTLSLEVAT